MIDVTTGWTLGRLLAWRARETPHQELVAFQPLDDGAKVERYTYADVDARATAVARGLLSLGLGPGDRIALHLPNGPGFLWSWLGAARAGVAIVPLNTRLATRELAWCVRHCQAAAVVTDDEVAHSHADAWAGVTVATPQSLLGRGRAPDAPGVPGLAETGGAASGTDDVAVLYTSGTTARPKGVRLTHASYIWAGQRMAELQRLGPGDRHLVVTPYFHINAQTYSTMPALWAGASLVVAPRFSASRYWRWIGDHQITASSVVTTMVRILLNASRDPSPAQRSSLRWMGCAAVNPELEERFDVGTIGWYGMTETVTVPIATPRTGPRRAGCIGRVMPGYAARLVDESGKLLPPHPGTVGRLHIRGIPGQTLMRGYLFDAAATAAALSADGWLDTGDLLETHEGGFVRFVGRVKEMIKVGGENVAAREVEAVLAAHPAVVEAAAIGVRDAVLDQVVHAYVILRPGAEASPQALHAWCVERLADFKVPRRVEVCTSLPRVTLGKIDKKKLLASHELDPGHG